MRKFVLIALAAAVPLAFSAEAIAANKVTYNLKITPAKKSVSSKNLRTVSINPVINYVNVDSTKVVDPLGATDLILPQGFKFVTKGFKTCPKSVLAAKTCGRKGLLGAGSASFVAAAAGEKIVANTAPIPGKVPANGGILNYLSGSNRFFILSNAEKPVQDQRTFPGQLISGSKPTIRIPVYKIVVAGLTISVTKFDAPIGGIVKASTTCPRGGWVSTAKTVFRTPDGNAITTKVITATAKVKCS